MIDYLLNSRVVKRSEKYGINKKIFADKSRIAILSVCLLMLSVVMASALTGETLAATTVKATFIYSSGGTDSKSCTYDDITTFSCEVTAPTSSNGWDTYSSCTTGSVKSGAKVSLTMDKTYYQCSNSSGNETKVTATFKKGSTVVKSETCSYSDSQGQTSCSIALPDSSSLGYGDGWGTSSSCTSGKDSGSNVSIGKDTTYYACRAKFTVTFNSNYEGSSSTTKTYLRNSNYTNMPTLQREGYTFLGWFTEKSGGTQKTDSDTIINSDHILYAQWQNAVYTVYFNGNGGTPSIKSEKAVYGVQYLLGASATREGYTFLGWYDSPNDNGVKITKDTLVSAISDHTLYAHWSAKEYTVTFNSNEGTSANPATKTVTFDSTYGTLPTTSRSGYTFDGWYTEKDGGTLINSNSNVTATSNHVLYAHWSANAPVDVIFNANGGSWASTGQTTLEMTNSVYNDYYKIPDINPTRSGYAFDGWYTEKTGGTEITTTTKITKNSNHTLYAHWKDNYDSSGTLTTVTAKFNTNYGTPTSYDNRTCSYNDNISVSCSIKVDDLKPQRSNYDFKGWGTSSSCTIGETEEITLGGNKTFYACWTEKSTTVTTTYTINYNANGGKGAPSSQTKTKGKKLTLRTGVPTREGYKFLGWSKSSTATSATYQAGGTYSNDSSTTLYAVWEANKYTVTYNSNGGTGTMSNSEYTYGVSKELSTNSFTKEGYTFKCWNDKADGTGINYTDKQSVTISENLTLYAQWKSNDSSSDTGNMEENEITYIVRYDANGGTGTMKDDEHVYNFAKSLAKNTFSRTGYKFSSWNTKVDGTGTSYADGATVSNLTTTNGKVVTLYAQWVLNVVSGDGGTEEGGTGNGENNEYPTVSLTLDKAYETKLDLSVNVSNITDADNAEAEIYLILMEGTGFETGRSYVIDTVKNCKNGKNVSTITDLKSDTDYTFQVVLLTENGSILGDEYVTFKTEPKKSIIDNITESPQTGMLATILVSLICIGSMGGVMYYRRKVKI